MTRAIERLGTISGLLAPVITLGAIAIATILSPTFVWTESALSDLGARGVPTARLFNGGLIIGSITALPFGVLVFMSTHNRVEQAGAVLFGLTAVALAAIGVFPTGTPQHLPAAVSFYLLLSFSLWTYGIGNVVAGKRWLGVLTVCLGILNIAAWVVWAIAFQAVIPGLALPESVGAIILGAWIFGTTIRIRIAHRSESTAESESESEAASKQ
jgi:hypothetical membrane protein